MGKPTTFSPEVRDLLLIALRAGSYVEAACEAAGVPRRTFYQWWAAGDPRGADPAQEEMRAFRAAVEKAKAEAEVRQVAVIATAAKTQWQAAAWLLERRYPERWARASQRERDAADAPTVTPSSDAFSEVDQLALKRKQRVD